MIGTFRQNICLCNHKLLHCTTTTNTSKLIRDGQMHTSCCRKALWVCLCETAKSYDAFATPKTHLFHPSVMQWENSLMNDVWKTNRAECRKNERKQQEWLNERQRKRWSNALFWSWFQWQSHSSLTSVLTVYMSAPAARQLQRSVIIIYLFRMLRGEGYGCL